MVYNGLYNWHFGDIMSDYKYCNMMGDPIPDWAQDVMNTVFPDLTLKEKQLYDKSIHSIERYFENWNREICAHCPRIYGKTHYPGRSKMVKEAGCCANCSYDGYKVGFFDAYERDLFKDVMEISNKRTGFFDLKNHRCNLPRHIRSYTCLLYSCSGFDWYVRSVLTLPIKIIREYTQKNKKIPIKLYELIDIKCNTIDELYSLQQKYYTLLNDYPSYDA